MTRASLRQNWAELAGLVEEVAHPGWLHPAWWSLVGAAGLVERFARRPAVPVEELYTTYLAADGGPHIDTFMARPGATGMPPAATGVSPAATGVSPAAAVLRARAARAALEQTDARLGGAGLGCHVLWDRGWLATRPLAGGARHVAFVTPVGVFLADLDQEDSALERGLALILAGRSPGASLIAVDPRSSAPTPAVLAVHLAEVPLPIARHLHRQAWSRGGGPWLGVGRCGALEVASTCHLAADGYAHACLADLYFERMASHSDDCSESCAVASAIPTGQQVEPLGIAWDTLSRVPTFPACAYAFGRALEKFHRSSLPAARRRRARHSPTFQVPVAPGDGSDSGSQTRRLRRVLHGLVAVRITDGEFEPFDEFRARLRPALARDMAGDGLLTRLLQFTLRSPMPDRLRRWALAARGLPSAWLPPVAVLGGRGRLSSIRFAEDHAPRGPLIAASAPALGATRRDPAGGSVLTLIHGRDGVTATVAGSGLAGDSEGARRLLDVWRDQLGET